MKAIARGPWVGLLALLAVYVPVILILQPDRFVADESRYARFAVNLSRGHYSPRDEVHLWSGPGYPLVLLPFVLARAPLWAPRLLNAGLSLGAVLLFYRTLRPYVGPGPSTLFAGGLGLHPLLLQQLPRLMTEPLALFLVCGVTYSFTRLARSQRPGPGAYAAVAAWLGYLALTKVLFGYVLVAALLLSLPFLAGRRGAHRAAPALALALALCAPYLAYTYSLTGKPFYWGDNGGLALYCMSSPYPGDLGDWYLRSEISRVPELAENHEAFFAELDRLSPVERDEALKRRAWRNLVTHPAKYALNVTANVGRLLFNYPYSYHPQKVTKLVHIVSGAYLLAAATLAFGLTVARFRAVPPEILALAVFGLIAFGAHSLLAAEVRYLLPLIPIALLWIGFAVCRLLHWGLPPRPAGVPAAGGQAACPFPSS